MQFQRKVVTPEGFVGEGAENEIDALRRGRALLAEEGRFCTGYWFHKEGGSYEWQSDPDSPLCGSWSACADGAISLVTVGLLRVESDSPFGGPPVWWVTESSWADAVLGGQTAFGPHAPLIMENPELTGQAQYLVNAAQRLSESAPEVANEQQDACHDQDKWTGTEESVPVWNDDVFQTRENVLDWFDYTIRKLQEKTT